MDLDASSLAAGLVVSCIGLGLFKYGRKLGRIPHIITGVVMMVFPYVVPSVLAMFAIAALLCGLLYMATRAGY